VRVRVKSPDVDTFVERFARNVSTRSIFLPSREVREVGSVVRFEVRLVGGEIAFAGEGTVSWVRAYVPDKPTGVAGISVRFTAIDPECEEVLTRLVKRRQALEASAPASGPQDSTPSLPLSVASPSADADAGRSESDLVVASVASLTLAVPASQEVVPSERAVVVEPPAPAEPEAPPRAAPSVPAPAPEASPRPSLRRRSAWAVGLALVAAAAVRLGQGTPPELPPRPLVASTFAPAARASALQATAVAPAPVPDVAPRDAEVTPAPRPRIQVDELVTGPGYERFACTGATNELSLSRHGRVNVCFRVAQQTEDEEVTVVWKHEGIFMKTPVKIPPKHPGYRTRAFIPLYKERIGDWSVRIVSSKGVELAQTTFRVVP
jgi:hypothetical protein